MDLNHPLLALAADEPPLFPASYPQLRRMDRSVICQICKEYFQGPVTVECGHSFCSQVSSSKLQRCDKVGSQLRTVHPGIAGRHESQEVSDLRCRDLRGVNKAEQSAGRDHGCMGGSEVRLLCFEPLGRVDRVRLHGANVLVDRRSSISLNPLMPVLLASDRHRNRTRRLRRAAQIP